jgi:DUF4097 and DUF4098 domain-containing protein YvlB
VSQDIQPFPLERHLIDVEREKSLQRSIVMGMKSKCAVVLSVVLATAGWVAAGSEYEEIVDRSYPLDAGGIVALENVNGDVSIEIWESAEVRMYAVKRSSSQDLLDRLEIEVSTERNAVRIDTQYPSMRHSDHERGSFMKVEYTLTVPRTARLDDIDLVNGNLTVVGVEGGVSVATVNGNIDIRDCAGDAEISTVNGAIEARVDRLGHGDRLDMETVNGRLDLYLASSIDADVAAESVNGKLRNDFGIEVHKGKYVGSDFRGSVGGGGAKVELETVNGSINVHRW